MRRPLLLLPLALAALVAGAADAAPRPKPKPVTQKFDATAPVPFPGLAETTVVTSCFDGQEGVSKDTTRVTLPFDGSLVVKVDFTGDWDLLVRDSKGKQLGAAENWQFPETGAGSEKLAVKKVKKGPVDIAVCNWAGMAEGVVTWTLTPAK